MKRFQMCDVKTVLMFNVQFDVLHSNDKRQNDMNVKLLDIQLSNDERQIDLSIKLFDD